MYRFCMLQQWGDEEGRDGRTETNPLRAVLATSIPPVQPADDPAPGTERGRGHLGAGWTGALHRIKHDKLPAPQKVSKSIVDLVFPGVPWVTQNSFKTL